jgi:hypothetical protein
MRFAQTPHLENLANPLIPLPFHDKSFLSCSLPHSAKEFHCLHDAAASPLSPYLFPAFLFSVVLVKVMGEWQKAHAKDEERGGDEEVRQRRGGAASVSLHTNSTNTLAPTHDSSSSLSRARALSLSLSLSLSIHFVFSLIHPGARKAS